MDINKLLNKAMQLGASDLHLAPRANPRARINGALINIEDHLIYNEDIEKTFEMIVPMNERAALAENGELECSYPSIYGRCRVNFFKVRSGISVAFRILSSEIPSFKKLGLPEAIDEFCALSKGLVLVAGPARSGKSTTLASIIDNINNTREGHIITLEYPVEHIHRHKKCIINQRDISKHSKDVLSALRTALRQDPDVIMISEMMNTEIIRAAMTAAETGHLVFAEMHTSGAVSTIENIIDSFPSHNQEHARKQLSTVLEGIISQQLLPKEEGFGLEPMFEIMSVTPSIRELIREGNTQSIQNKIQTGSGAETKTIDGAILKLYENKKNAKDKIIDYSQDRETSS